MYPILFTHDKNTSILENICAYTSILDISLAFEKSYNPSLKSYQANTTQK